MANEAQPTVWRVFLPLVPWAFVLFLVYAGLRPFGVGWLAPVVTVVCVALVLLYARVARH
jgi:hypothetical protein